MSKKQREPVLAAGRPNRGKILLGWAIALLTMAAQAQSPANPFDYTRATKFGYEPATGRLSTTTQEPSNPALCATTTIGYDAYGNASTQDIANCAGAAGRTKFIARRVTTLFEAVASQPILVNGSSVNVAVPAGTAATRVDNALSQSVTTQVDPRFGAAIRVQDPNGAVVKTELDDFGRTVRAVAADGTSIVTRYCILSSSGADTSSNSSGCPGVAGTEVPADARSFTHAEPRNTSDAKSGPFVRTYRDALGRTIRVVSESFDGPNQTTGRAGALVASDTVFNASGQTVLQTGAYFLASGSANTGGSGDVAVTRTDYDDLGRPSAVYAANPTGTKSTSFGSSGSFGYGSYGARTAALTSFGYSGLTSTVTDDKARSKTTEKNALGQEIRVTDPLGAQIAKFYDAFGLLLQTKDALQNSITISYDILGRRLLLNDPDKGVVQFCYDALGQLKASQNSKMRGSHATNMACPDNDDAASPVAVANWNTFGYDLLGRMTKQIAPSDTYQWAYDSGTGAKGRLSQSSTATGVTKSFYYDTLGRALSSRVDIANGPSFATLLSYDAATGRVGSKVYPTGFKVSYGYTALGYLSALNADTALNLSPLPATPGGAAPAPVALPAGQALWLAQAIGADGRLEKAKLGSGVSASQGFEGVGRLSNQVVSAAGGATLVSMGYGWDNLNNLNSRIDNIGAGAGAVSESFGYDELNRLKQYIVAAPAVPNLQRQVELQYNALGMMLSKTDVGNYRYGGQACGAAHPHAPAGVAGSTLCYDLNGNLISSDQGKYRALTYTEYDKVLTAAGPSGGPSYAWSYDAEGMRIKEQRTQGSLSRTLWYLQPDAVGGLGFEREVNGSDESKNANRHFLDAGGIQVGVIVSMGAMPTLGAQTAPTALASLAVNKLEYWHKDHLGSLIATTDHAGGLTARYAYDPYGKRRYSDGNYDANGNLVVDWANDANKGTGRGFTGHEELDDIGLVNMNGRVYDDQAGLFLQGDPVIKDPSNTQAYSRYAYVLNNPLNLIDPSGFEDARPPDARVQIDGQRNLPQITYAQMVDWLRKYTKPWGLDSAWQYSLEYTSAAKGVEQAIASFGADGQKLFGITLLVDPSGKVLGVIGLTGKERPSKNRQVIAWTAKQFREGIAAAHDAYARVQSMLDLRGLVPDSAHQSVTGIVGHCEGSSEACLGHQLLAQQLTTTFAGSAEAVAEVGERWSEATVVALLGMPSGNPVRRIQLYRGVASSHPGYENALKGIAKPRGGRADPILHSGGDTSTPFTSWTTDPFIARDFATLGGTEPGVLLSISVPRGLTVSVPENIQMLMNEAEVLLRGTVRGANVTLVR